MEQETPAELSVSKFLSILEKSMDAFELKEQKKIKQKDNRINKGKLAIEAV